MNEATVITEQITGRFIAAWTARDAKALAHVFTADADFTNVFGQRFQGRGAIEAQHAPLFTTMFKNSCLTPVATDVRLLTDGLAAVDITWTMSDATDPMGNAWPDRKGLMSLVVIKEKGTWGIIVMHNMELPAMKRP